MIKSVMVINTQGKPRLAKFYEHQTVEKQRELIRKVFSVLSCRAESVSNFMEADSIFGQDSHLVYKHFATLYFVFVFDSSENELAMLDLIQEILDAMLHSVPSSSNQSCKISYKVLASAERIYHSRKKKCLKTDFNLEDIFFVETLDKCFKNVCELDIVFNHDKMQTVIDEMIFGGQVLETNSAEIMRAVEEISKLEAASSAISLVPKSVSGWRSR